jgi:hypothetical protein
VATRRSLSTRAYWSRPCKQSSKTEGTARAHASGVEGAAGVAMEVDAVRSRANHRLSTQGKTPVAAVEGDEARVVGAAADAVGAVADVGAEVVVGLEDCPATAILLLPT